MKNESTGRSREGLPPWIVAASIGLALIAASAIVVRSTGVGPSRFRPGLSSDGVVSADDADDRDTVAVDDDDAPTPAQKGRPATILMSLPSRDAGASVPSVAAVPASSTVERARREMAGCLARYRAIHDYTCVFHKRERIDGRLVEPHVMAMKVRTEPLGIYFKFVTPDKGREAIFEPARNKGKIVFHDVGLGRLLAGTMLLDPRGTMAMEDNRHPITDAGLGALIETLCTRWESELTPGESLVEVHEHAKVGDRACTLIETIHPAPGPSFLFHKVKVYIDREHGLPIHFEGYDWPKSPGGAAEMIEEYTYSDLKTDVGLTDLDFDAANPRYSFGRF